MPCLSACTLSASVIGWSAAAHTVCSCSAIANTKPLINQKIFKHTASLSTTTGNNSTSNIHQAAGDSGASSHHFRVSDTAKLTNIQDTKSPISIQTAWLQLPTLSSDGCQVHIFRAQDLTEFSLVTIGQLCDADCTAHYDKSRMWVTDKHGTDMAGRFPYKSFKASQYMLIMYCTDAK